MLDKYLNKDGSLNYQKLYKDMEKMTGFNAKARKEQHYMHIVTAYRAHRNPEVVPF